MSEQSSTFLFASESGELVPVNFYDGVTPAQINAAQLSWAPRMERLQSELEKAGVSEERWPEHRHWNWNVKFLKTLIEDDLRLFGLEYEDEMQGLIFATPNRKSKLDPKKRLVYVDYLATAPWNLSYKNVQQGRFKLVGSVLLAAAVQLSRDEGTEGRVGLYALPQSVSWYQKLNFTEVVSAAQDKLRYFELQPDQAKEFLPEN